MAKREPQAPVGRFANHVALTRICACFLSRSDLFIKRNATGRSHLSVSAMETTAMIRKWRQQRPRDVAATATRRAARPTRPPCKPVTSRRWPMASCRPHFRALSPSVGTVDVDELPGRGVSPHRADSAAAPRQNVRTSAEFHD